jgi:RHS repeat-associated protein
VGRASWLIAVGLALCPGTLALADDEPPAATWRTLSPYMNSIPPSRDYLCVGNGPSNVLLHPDRAPYTQLAQQDGVILFSGTAPQQGLNFQLSAGALVYRNQMSTLGSSEPSPQLGTAGTLRQQGLISRDEYDGDLHMLPWTEARWHQGEDISWGGYRHSTYWIGGLPYWDYEIYDGSGEPPAYFAICDDPPSSDIHDPVVRTSSASPLEDTSVTWNMRSCFNLQLSRGIYQMSKVRGSLEGGFDGRWDVCPHQLREPWFQGRGHDPAFYLALDPPAAYFERLTTEYFPNFHCAYTYTNLELDGGRLMLDFERSGMWPHRGSTLGHESSSGAAMAERAYDEYGNTVLFDRLPEYGWETDYKTPGRGNVSVVDFANDEKFATVPQMYEPSPSAWRLPHKRVRSVRVQAATDQEETWTVAFIYEHPESDRISKTDTSDDSLWDAGTADGSAYWRSIASDLQQAAWSSGRLPDLNDQTTLLTVQAYKGARSLKGAQFQDDYSVWADDLLADNEMPHRVNVGPEFSGDANGDGCPGICGVDDDGDGLVDEAAGLGPDAYLDDNEDGRLGWGNCLFPDQGCTHGYTHFYQDGSRFATDPLGDANEDGCPGVCGVDDDGDGLIDEDTNGYLPYLDVDALGGRVECSACQNWLNNGGDPPSFCLVGDELKQTHLTTACENPLYSDGTFLRDPFASFDDDEDGLIDEDGYEDPLLVHLRALDVQSECATGVHPFVPAGMLDGVSNSGGCQAIYDAGDDPWTYQVQYVYARNDPLWLLSRRNADDGTVDFRTQPAYYYFTPFDPDLNRDGDLDDEVYSLYGQTVLESDLVTLNDSSSPWNGFVVDSETELNESQEPGAQPEGDGKPNVHPDCVPHPDYRGPQGRRFHGDDWDTTPSVGPASVNLIKRVVRYREDVTNPNNFIEQIWLYRYNDFGFLKAVFDPTAVQAIIDAAPDDEIETADDILQLADTDVVGGSTGQSGGQPLLLFASQWYTYYNPRGTFDWEDPVNQGLVPCYDVPFFDSHGAIDAPCDPNAPENRWPVNACDGEVPWADGYVDELHTDPDCSAFMRQDCGPCFAREINTTLCRDDPSLLCYDGYAEDENQLAQLGIPDAQPRLRKHVIKTARVRGADGEMHLYRFDYLGAASGVYSDPQSLNSYADPHNITIVDELVPQTPDEYANPDGWSVRNEFYIYEDDFRLVLDGRPLSERPSELQSSLQEISTHYFTIPSKVKTRRVVVMNYYGIAISDRLIVTPGFIGDVTSLVDDERYELTNMRGQTKHVYDPSWVATLREFGAEAVRDSGRVLVQLFGGEGGWHNVLRGVAWGTAGGNLYDQQCRTPEVLDEVPVQRVAAEDLNVVTVTRHYARDHDGSPLTPDIRDLPSIEAVFSRPVLYSDFSITDPAGTISADGLDLDDDGCFIREDAWDCDAEEHEGEPGCVECEDDAAQCDVVAVRGGVDLHVQDPVVVETFPGSAEAERDGTSLIQYHYDFWDEGDLEERARWKLRWSESIDFGCAGGGTVGLEIWYFDQNGRLRFHGRGAGTDGPCSQAGDFPVVRASPFYITYYGYDDFGRLAIQVDDLDLSNDDADLYAHREQLKLVDLFDLSGEDHDLSAAFGDLHGCFVREDYVSKCWEAAWADGIDDSAAANLTTIHQYNDLGMRVATRVGRYVGSDPQTGDPFNPDSDKSNYDAVRHEYVLVANRIITLQPQDEKTYVVWEDEHSYQVSYEHVIDGDVYGSTTVSVFDKGGKFLESRQVSYPPDVNGVPNYDKVTDFGWAVTLADYTYDGALDAWGPSAIPEALWATCGEDPDPPRAPTCNGEYNLLEGTISPAFPGASVEEDNWPLSDVAPIITLARSFQRFEQASTLKPTQDVVFRDYSDPGTDEGKREVVRHYLYDLEERIARQEEPDGSVSRFLFDSKRRPTKTFKGGADTCSDWFPVPLGEPDPADDDMVLVEHRLYNDGLPEREYNPLPGPDEGRPGVNEDFPKDAGQLVRVREFTDNPESCDTAYDEDAASRDTQFTYDKRGRQIIRREVAVGYGDSTRVDEPAFVSATTYVYDNLDRAVLTATWSEDRVPSSETIEGQWGEVWEATETNIVHWDKVAEQVLPAGPLTLSRTIFDDRGRVRESRAYHVPDTAGLTYASTLYFRDDLNRVIRTDSGGTATINRYDSLGRVVATSQWTVAEAGGDLLVEISRTESDYDALGNVLAQRQFDRKHADLELGQGIDSDPLAEDAQDDDAIVTYTHHWYDNARRLSATAYYGTGGTHGYTNDQGVPARDDAAPIWDSDEQRFEVYDAGFNGAAIDNALVTLYKYDLAGRRNWTRDARGIVRRTWYNLLGSPVLEAENWPDPDDVVAQHYEGPVRYTAYHYTQAGLLDMIVALMFTEDGASVTPAHLNWTEDASNKYVATGLALVPGAPMTLDAFQATSFVYGAPVHNATDGEQVSTAPGAIAEIRYPKSDTGLPDDTNDKLTFAYTISGQVAARTDQRGVTLHFEYGTGDSPYPHDQLTAVKVDLGNPPASGVDDAVQMLSFAYDRQARLTEAATYDGLDPATAERTSRIAYTYDSAGNLLSETLAPAADPFSPHIGTTQYTWSNVGTNHNRLDRIIYPTGLNLALDYGLAGGTHDRLDRAFGLKRVENPGGGETLHTLLAYNYTGSGRLVGKAYGDGVADVDLTTGGLNPYGRLVDLNYTHSGATLHRYEYGYDESGNRLFSRVNQVDSDNVDSWLYKYDRLNRLSAAGRGILNPSNSGFAVGAIPESKTWKLDLLGNWSGGSDLYRDSVQVFTDADLDLQYDPGESLVHQEHHSTNLVNEIVNQYTTEGQDPEVSTSFVYDAAGNLTNDGEYLYTYDAWNRVVRVRDKDILASIAEYRYDALGRRINKVVSSSGNLNTTADGDYYYYDGNRAIVEQRHPAAGDPVQREYVFGLEYIDEAVAQFDTTDFDDTPTTETYFLLIDANYNVVAMLDAAQLGEVYEQYRYWPYGALEAVDEDHNGDDILAVIDFANDPELLSTPLGHQGLFRDHETGSIHNRGRDYDPDLSRFRQRDPNETALLLATALVTNGQAADALSGMPGSGLYADGLHLYIYQRGNPLIGTDPAGLFVYIEMLIDSGIRGDLLGMYSDVSGSLVNSMKGIAALQLQRHAAIDNMLNVAAYDFSGVDQAMLIYHGFQVAMLGIGAKDALLQLPRAVVGSVQYGARAFSKFAKRAGGRRKFLDILEGGEAGIRRFFGFGGRGGVWSRGGFRVGRHGDMPSPRPTGQQSHHGVLDKWMRENFAGYRADDAPTVLMPNEPHHNATRGVFNRWRAEIARRQGVNPRNINWQNVSRGEVWRLAEDQFTAAGIPQSVRNEYWRQFNQYLGTLE